MTTRMQNWIAAEHFVLWQKRIVSIAQPATGHQSSISTYFWHMITHNRAKEKNKDNKTNVEQKT